MPAVRRVTSVTVVTLLALAGPLVPRADAVAEPARAVHRSTNLPHPTAGRSQEKVQPKQHHTKKLTRTQRYYKWHPRLIRAARIAVDQRGDRYRWGAEGPRRFDCSGLVYYAYRKAGFANIPRTAQEQYGYVRHIRKSQLARGDLMFFRSHRRVYHVAVFLYWKGGRRVFIHSPNPGGRVRKAVPWTDGWRAGTLRPSHKRHPRPHHKPRSQH